MSRNATGGAWLLADLSLNIWALAIVKSAGADIPAAQLVFLRALAGLVVIAPWIWGARARFREARAPGLHLARVALSTVALIGSFHAVSRLPLALFTAVNFTRPLMLIALAALVLGERAPVRRWAGALLGLGGVFLAVRPGSSTDASAIAALLVAVVAGTAAVAATRRLGNQPTIVLMAAYTAGLAATTAPWAASVWVPIAAADWPALLAVGLFAQAAQFCFLQAHRLAEAGLLAVLGYSSLILSTAVGWTVFAEVPGPGFAQGAALIVAGTWIARRGSGSGAGPAA